MYAELVDEYARATVDESWARAVLITAKYFQVSPYDVLQWDWEMFREALGVMREEAEQTKKAARRR